MAETLNKELSRIYFRILSLILKQRTRESGNNSMPNFQRSGVGGGWGVKRKVPGKI